MGLSSTDAFDIPPSRRSLAREPRQFPFRRTELSVRQDNSLPFVLLLTLEPPILQVYLNIPDARIKLYINYGERNSETTVITGSGVNEDSNLATRS